MLLSSSVNKFTLDELVNLKPDKGLLLKSHSTFHAHHPHEMKVISPFYQRDKCPLKGPCLCPYHRKKKMEILYKKKVKPKISTIDNQNPLQKIRQIKTQQSENLNIREMNNRLCNQSSYGKNLRELRDTKTLHEKYGYTNILHKVQCRNSQYEEYLKKSGFSHLNTKYSGHANRSREEFYDGENTEYTSRYKANFQSQNSKNNQTFGNDFALRKYDRKYTRKKTNFSPWEKENEAEERLYSVEQAEQIIQSLLNGNLKMTLPSMKRIRRIFSKLIEEGQKELKSKNEKNSRHSLSYGVKQQQQMELTEKDLNKTNIEGIPVIEDNYYCIDAQKLFLFQKRRTLLNKLDSFISETEAKLKRKDKSAKKSKKTNKDSIDNNSQMRNDFDNEDFNENQYEKLEQETKGGKSKKLLNSSNAKGGYNVSLNVDQQNNLDKEEAQDYWLAGEYSKVNNKNTNPNSIETKFKNMKKKQKKISEMSVNGGVKGLKKRLEKYGKRNNNQTKTIVIPDVIKEQRSKTIDKKEVIQQKPESQKENLPQITHQPENTVKKNQKQRKLYEIINQVNEERENIVDKNYLKLKKYIERNRKFIRKMELKLLHNDLGALVIEPTDSLITRKKKLRYLKQILTNIEKKPEEKKEFYDQIIKYLDIYTEHCNLVLKRDITRKKKQENEYIEVQSQIIEPIFGKKNVTDSLKFINLYQNLEIEKEKKLEGWIAIPQYITKDYTRLKKNKKLQHSNKLIQSLLNSSSSEGQLQDEDQLIQAPLENTCTIKPPDEPILCNSKITVKHFKPRLEKTGRKEKIHSFQSKIQEFRRKLLKNP